MFTTILVPLDGSSQAEAALSPAARIAFHTGAELLLVHVVNLTASSWTATLTSNPLVAEAVIEADLKEATDYLEKVAISSVLKGITVRTQLHRGHVASTLLEVAAASQSNLIVLCRSGKSGLKRWAIGSTAEKVIRHATCPVLVVPGDAFPPQNVSADLVHPLRMLIPLDGSINAQAALEPGATLLADLADPGEQVALHLVHVIIPSWREERDVLFRDVVLPQARQAMIQIVEQIRAGSLAPSIAQHQIPVTWSVLVDMDVASTLLRVEDGIESADPVGGCQLIALSTHGRGGIQRWMLGSITERVLSATTHPILIVPLPIVHKRHPESDPEPHEM